jgi:predicted alpha/beta superfamily hydrolase
MPSMHRLRYRELFRALVFLAVAAGCSRPPQAPPAPPSEQPIAVATHEGLHSKVLNEDRGVDVYVPPSYAKGNERYPVLYLLDGNGHFLDTVGLTRFLARGGGLGSQIPELIVVSVLNTDRNRDLAPIPKPNLHDGVWTRRLVSETLPTAGGADKFLRFLTEELIPKIDGQYRTAPFRILFGHSLGGLFALYAFKYSPDVFRGIIAASPPLWWNDGEFADSISTFASGLAPSERSLFFTVGDEPEGMVRPSLRLDSALRAVPVNRLRWRFTQLPDENHGSTPLLTLYNGLKFVFEGWPLPKKLVQANFSPEALQDSSTAEPDGAIEEVVAHYSQFSSRYGFADHPPEILLNGIGYLLLFASRPDAALVAFKRNAALYPRSANAQDSWADGLAQTGRFSEAVAQEERAIVLATQSKDPRLNVWEQRASEFRAKAAAAGTK